MKNNGVGRKLILALSTGLLLASGHLASAQTGATENTPAMGKSAFADLIQDYASGYEKLGIPDLQLSYVENLRALVGNTDIARERTFFSKMRQRLALLDLAQANSCQALALREIQFESDLNLQKLSLLDKFVNGGGQRDISESGLYSMRMGKEWYAYFLKRWLTVDTTPEELMSFGKQELTTALGRYRALQAKMGYAGRDQEFYAYLKGEQFYYPGDQTPQSEYEARQAIVYHNLGKLFLPQAIEPASIKQSSRGAAMPADAYYETDERTFYFNKARQRFERRSIDWLLIHESTPGHHYQTSYARLANSCPTVLPRVFYAAYVEGWGAYVEEFGAQVGLYRQDSDELGAVEWDLVRSIRVVLDVGINYYGWSQQQAFEYWHQMLPMVPEIAEREITRVRNWPVQAIAYKMGAAEIRRVRSLSQERLGDQFDIRQFHDAVLRQGAVPLKLLPGLVGVN